MSENRNENLNKYRKIGVILSVLAVVALILLKLFAPGVFDGIFGTDSSEADQTTVVQASNAASGADVTSASPDNLPDEKGTSYTSAEELALYIHTYGHLPSNFITKEEARAFGWSGGGLDKYKKGACIGGDVFSNNEKLLPEKNGRKYYECDVGTLGAKERGAERLVYSSDGLIFYTSDHYSTFTQLY